MTTTSSVATAALKDNLLFVGANGSLDQIVSETARRRSNSHPPAEAGCDRSAILTIGNQEPFFGSAAPFQAYEIFITADVTLSRRG
jgi:hypothetical protein